MSQKNSIKFLCIFKSLIFSDKWLDIIEFYGSFIDYKSMFASYFVWFYNILHLLIIIPVLQCLSKVYQADYFDGTFN